MPVLQRTPALKARVGTPSTISLLLRRTGNAGVEEAHSCQVEGHYHNDEYLFPIQIGQSYIIILSRLLVHERGSVKSNFLRIFSSLVILFLLLPSCSIQAQQTKASTETPEQEVVSEVDPTLPEGLTSSETPEQEVMSDVDPTLPEGLTSSEWQSIQNQIMSNLSQQAYLKASNTDTLDYFGRSVAVSNDIVVVGAPDESSAATGVNGDQNDNSASLSGAAYVFVRDGTTWTQQAYLKASNTDIENKFGISVAVFNDTIVVGALGEASAATGVNGDQNDNSAGVAGAAYVFVRDGTTWTQQAYLKASNTDAYDWFGISVAVFNDTIVVGAAYVFVRDGTTWTQQAYLKASNTDAEVYFGRSVAVSNDTIVICAVGESIAAYVFVSDGTTWTQQAYLKESNTDAYDHFGSSVVVSNDTIVVGAWGESSAATGVNGYQYDFKTNVAGAAYVFVRNGTTWTQQAYLKASIPDAFDLFGTSVAVSNNTIVVGAYGEDSAATGVNGDQNNNNAGSAGAAYVFVRDGTTWTQQAYLKASNTGVGDQFGYSVAVSNDTIVVGAKWEDSAATGINGDQNDNSAQGAGAAYVFVRDGTTWEQQAYLKASNTDADDNFGYPVAVSNDTIVVGAWPEDSAATGVNGDQNNNSAVDAGAAYVFVRDGTTWTQQAYLKASNTDAYDGFGGSVAVSNDTIVVSANLEDSAATGVNGDQNNNSAVDAGAAYVFVRDGTTWTQQAYLKASNTDAYDGFGESVAVSDDTIVVGAEVESSAARGVNGNQNDNGAPNSGAAYVFVGELIVP